MRGSTRESHDREPDAGKDGVSVAQTQEKLRDVYRRLRRHYGPQKWWPADSPFEVMVGAVLTQSTSWTNVEKAIASLKAADALSPGAIRRMSRDELARTIYSAGFHNSKARKLKALADYLGDRFDDDLDAMRRVDHAELRAELLGVHGIGNETADAILLYALGMPSFVIDAYTRRLLSRLDVRPTRDSYDDYQRMFEESLEPDPRTFDEYHALIVTHGKSVCMKRPRCADCCLLEICPTGRESESPDRQGAAA